MLLSLTLSNRAMTRIHIKNMHSLWKPLENMHSLWKVMGTLLFCIGRSSAIHRPTIGRQSDDHRPMIGRSITNKYIYYMYSTCVLHTGVIPIVPLLYKTGKIDVGQSGFWVVKGHVGQSPDASPMTKSLKIGGSVNKTFYLADVARFSDFWLTDRSITWCNHFSALQ